MSFLAPKKELFTMKHTMRSYMDTRRCNNTHLGVKKDDIGYENAYFHGIN